MYITESDKKILVDLVGDMPDETASSIFKTIDCFLHPSLSLFIPAIGQCEYAITESHKHPAFSFIYYFQPVSEFVIEGKNISYDLANGKCLSAISPGIGHQEIPQESFQSYIAIMVKDTFFCEEIKQYTDQIPDFQGEVYVPHPELLGLLRCFMLEANSNRAGRAHLLEHLAHVIVHLIAWSVIDHSCKTIPLYNRFEVDRAIAYMNSHFSEKITVDDLAQQIHWSSGHFSKVFKSVTGSSPIDFLQMIRLQKARMMLLNSAKSITEIAIECGFVSSSYFSYCFLDKYKTTPSDFRQSFL